MPRNSTTTAAKKRGPGRPPHAPTAALRRYVSVAAGGGMRHEDIALALGISRETLAKHYNVELSSGALARRAEVLNALHAAAKKGSSSAARAYLEHTPELAAPPAEGVAPTTGAQPPAEPTKPQRLGKKEQAQAEAITAQQGTDWDGLLRPPAALQ
jgi:hypothetical protein